jgi:hypothetical protein
MSGPLARNTKRSFDWPVIESPLDLNIGEAGGAEPAHSLEAIETIEAIS